MDYAHWALFSGIFEILIMNKDTPSTQYAILRFDPKIGKIKPLIV